MHSFLLSVLMMLVTFGVGNVRRIFERLFIKLNWDLWFVVPVETSIMDVICHGLRIETLCLCVEFLQKDSGVILVSTVVHEYREERLGSHILICWYLGCTPTFVVFQDSAFICPQAVPCLSRFIASVLVGAVILFLGFPTVYSIITGRRNPFVRASAPVRNMTDNFVKSVYKQSPSSLLISDAKRE